MRGTGAKGRTHPWTPSLRTDSRIASKAVEAAPWGGRGPRFAKMKSGSVTATNPPRLLNERMSAPGAAPWSRNIYRPQGSGKRTASRMRQQAARPVPRSSPRRGTASDGPVKAGTDGTGGAARDAVRGEAGATPRTGGRSVDVEARRCGLPGTGGLPRVRGLDGLPDRRLVTCLDRRMCSGNARRPKPARGLRPRFRLEPPANPAGGRQHGPSQVDGPSPLMLRPSPARRRCLPTATSAGRRS